MTVTRRFDAPIAACADVQIGTVFLHHPRTPKETAVITRLPLAGRVALAIVLAVFSGLIVAWYVNPPDNHGLKTSCSDLLRMNHRERVAVMQKAGVEPEYREQRIEYYLRDCRSHPEEGSYPIGDING